MFAGRYRLGESVPSVAFVDSFEAIDQTLNRPVVVSIVTERFSSNPAFVTEFVAQARAAMSLVHASIAQTFDVGTDAASGRAYAVSENVVGETLHNRLKSRALSLSEVADVLTQASSALSFAHTRGTRHLGLSPKALSITSTGRVKISGFGLYSLASNTAPSADLLAATVGGSGYLAPEQILRSPISDASDVYALGLILSEALCRRPTWDRTLTGDALVLRASATPVLPGTVLPEIPPTVDAIIGSATLADPRQRTSSAADFASALARFSSAQTPLVGIPVTLPVVANSSVMTTAPAGSVSAAPAAPGVDPALASLFPSDTLSTNPFTAAEFNAGRSRRRFVGSLLVAVASVLVIAVGILWVVSALPANVIPSTSRPVPGVVGYTYDEAAKAITDVGLRPLRIETVDANVAPGTVVFVSPAVGTKIEIGSTVTVNVSSGGKSVAVPNVTGMTSAAAQALLVKNGFVIGALTPANSGSALKDTVISSKPAVGESAASGSSVDLVIANGKVTIPNLVGKSVTDATAILTGPTIGLMPKLVAVTTCTATNPSKVKSQSVNPGDAPVGISITLTYCSGR